MGLLFSNTTLSQTIPAGFPVLEESLRRQQLLGAEEIKDFSFGLRPIVSLKQNRFNAWFYHEFNGDLTRLRHLAIRLIS